MKYASLVTALGLASFLISQSNPPPERPGPLPGGGALLVSGWRIQPAGRQIPLDTLPLTSALSKDGKYLLVLNCGYNPPSITVLRTDTMQEVGRTPVADGWIGLTFSPDGKFVYVGGASQASVYEFSFGDGKLALTRTFVITPAAGRTHRDFIGDVAVSPDGRLIYAAGLFQDAIYVINPQSGRVIEKFPTGRRPNRILFHPDGKSYLVTSWADGSVYHHNAISGERLGTVRLGQHPTDMIWRARKSDETDEEQKPWAYRLFVAAAHTNSVYVVGVSESKDMKLLEVVNIAMHPRQPLGMTPSALALNADQNQVYVACSDANAVAVLDVSEARSSVLGFLPTGWYPTAVRALADNRIVVLNGRGLRSYPNPAGPSPSHRPAAKGEPSPQYVARLQTGGASVIDAFDDDKLDKYTATVLNNSPYRDELLDRVQIPPGSPVPSTPGRPSPIQNVLYIVKENRTYDQVLGDLGKGNGDPKLTQFGEAITPNHHKLAREFVLFDNFYVNADVSADGRNWSTAAIAPDYVQKLWPNSYGQRRLHSDYEGGEPAALPPAGYIWSNALSAGLSIRNYGFWVNNSAKSAAGAPQVASVRDPQLTKHTNAYFRGFDLDYRDTERAQVFLRDLAEFEKSGQMPKLLFLRIGNDHTSGMASGKIAPVAAVADNDAALGMIVDAVSKSRFWPGMAIFVLEDDAQDGPDHVDSHRAPAFVISPYARRGVVDSTMYNTTSMLRTIELIVGLRPMTHFDAAARPMSAAFATKPDLKPYVAEQPRISLDQVNPAESAAAGRLDRVRRAGVDRTVNGEPPAPVRSYFSR